MGEAEETTHVITRLRVAFVSSVAAIILAATWFAVGATAAHAATLFISPSSGSYDVGDTFTGTVYVSSGDQAMNAASGSITFPPSAVEVVGIDKSGSIMNLWSQEPSYSNSSGSISFEGIVLNPGYTGTGGKIVSITFRAKGAGTAAVTFSGGSVLANDGLGTNILTAFGSGSYTIGSTEVPVEQEDDTTTEEEAEPTTNVPGAPTVSSSTHPDQSAWYKNTDPTFSWSMPAGVDGANVLADHNAGTDPGTASDGVRASWTYTGVEDGAWYFHVKLHNANGWGATSHFAFNIDTVAPDRVVITPQEPTNGAQAAFLFEASDALSGIDHYVISIDGGQLIEWVDDGSHIFTLSGLAEGEHVMAVDVVDAAGNVTSAESTTFSVAAAQEIVAEEVAAPVTVTLPRIPMVLWVILLLMVLVIALRILRKSLRYKILLVRKPKTREDRYGRTEKAFNRALRIMRKDVARQLKKGKGDSARRQAVADLSHIGSEVEREINELKHRL